MKPWLIFPFPTAFSIMHLIWSLSDNSQWISLLMCVLVYSQGADISGWLLKKRIKLGCFFFFPFCLPPQLYSHNYFQCLCTLLALSTPKEMALSFLLTSRHWFEKHLGKLLIFLEFLFSEKKSCLELSFIASTQWNELHNMESWEMPWTTAVSQRSGEL